MQISDNLQLRYNQTPEQMHFLEDELKKKEV